MKLSVVIAAWNDERSLTKCLEALREQVSPETEIIVVSKGAAAGDSPEAPSETVRFVEAEAGKTVPELRSRGISVARGEIVALTEDHCVPDPGWLSALLREHARGYQVVAGSLKNGTESSVFDWAVFLFDYSPFLPGRGRGRRLSGANVSFQRELLESLRSIWSTGFVEYEVEAALRERRIVPFASPSATVTHIGHYDRGAATSKFFLGGQFFGGTRREEKGIAGRILRILAAPVIPLVLVSRIGFRILSRPRLVGKYLLALPSLIVLAVAWSLGELVGYVSGKGSSSSHWK